MKIINICLIGLLATTLVTFAAEEKKAAETTDVAAVKTEKKENKNRKTMTKSENGLVILDVKKGTGAEAVSGKKVTVHYTGKLTDGKEFDSSLKSGQPFSFDLGAGQVIKGWDQGVAGMKVGGKRKLTIPAPLAYGERGAGGVIPPNATLVFDVELLKVE